MAKATVLHPTEDELSRYALDNEGAGVEEHARSCPSCARFVKELRQARAAVAAAPEPSVPPEIERRILAHREADRKPQAAAGARWTEWYHNPFVIGLGVVIAVLFFYVFVAFVLG